MNFVFKEFTPKHKSTGKYHGIAVGWGEVSIAVSMSIRLKECGVKKIILSTNEETKTIKFEKTSSETKGVHVKWERLNATLLDIMPRGRYHCIADDGKTFLFQMKA